MFLSFLGPFITESGIQMRKRSGKKKEKKKWGSWRADSAGEVLTYKHESRSSIPKTRKKKLLDIMVPTFNPNTREEEKDIGAQ